MNDAVFTIEDLDERLGILGMSGSGKTYAAKGLVERLIGQGVRLCVVDPLAAWWGLRCGVDGSAAGGLDVVIFGGEHADIPIDDSKGAAIARIVGESDIRCVIDLKLLGSGAARRRFMLPFVRTLAEVNRQPLHLILDEADLWAPQQPERGTESLLGAVEEIVRRGRMGGFIPWLISQRPAVIHKNVLSMINAMIIMAMTGPQDSDAIRRWISRHGDKTTREMVLDALPELASGEGFYWAPARRVLHRMTFPPNTTFDSSKTPERGDPVIEAKLAPVDLARIAELLALPGDTAAQPVKGKTLGELEPSHEVKKAESQGFRRGLEAGRAESRDEIARLRALLATVEERTAVASATLVILDKAKEQLSDLLRDIETAADIAHQEHADNTESGKVLVPPEISGIANSPALRAPRREGKGPRVTPPRTGEPARATSAPAVPLSTAARRMLAVLTERAPARFTWGQIATLAGLKASGGYFTAGKRELVSQSLVTRHGQLVTASATAIAAAGKGARAPRGPDAILAMWCEKLPQPAPDMLRALVESGPMAANELALLLGKQPTGGYWTAGVRVLRQNGLVEISEGVMRPAPALIDVARGAAGAGATRPQPSLA